MDDLRWRPTSKLAYATRKARGTAGQKLLLRKVRFWRQSGHRSGRANHARFMSNTPGGRTAHARGYAGNGIRIAAEIGAKNCGLPGISLRQPNNCKRGRYRLTAVASDWLGELLMIALAKSSIIRTCSGQVLRRDDQRQHFSAAPRLDVADRCLQHRINGRPGNQGFRNRSGDGGSTVLAECHICDMDQARNLHRLCRRGTWITGIYDS